MAMTPVIPLLTNSICVFALVFFSSLPHLSLCFKPRSFNHSAAVQSNWSPGGATWYGSPNGYGSDGGACGYGNAIEKAPFSSLVSAGGPSLFKSGKGCGACYQVKCNHNAACSGKPVTVVITDECPGGPSVAEAAHFDLSGTAFGAMAITGRADQLRKAGVLQIQYKRVPCNYPGWNVAFHVDAGSNPYHLSVVVEFEDGDGNLAGLDLHQSSSSPTPKAWISMQHSWGAVWELNSVSALKAPLSFKLISDSGKTIVANNLIPSRWQPGATYRSAVNFKV
ncbi:hypothetical protein AAC387_Pa08g0338 [Persea americana]